MAYNDPSFDRPKMFYDCLFCQESLFRFGDFIVKICFFKQFCLYHIKDSWKCYILGGGRPCHLWASVVVCGRGGQFVGPQSLTW